jgi:hypothetical protein
MSENSRSPEREEQRRRSVGEGNLNLGSNRNAEGKRQVSNREPRPYQIVDADGVSDVGQTQDQQTRTHSQGAFEHKGESGKRSVVKSGATLGRHITSKAGAEVSADRAKEVKSVRAKREKEAFGS